MGFQGGFVGKSEDRTLKRCWALQLGMLPFCLASPFIQSHHQMVTEKVPGLGQRLIPEHVNSICQEITCGHGRGSLGLLTQN